MFNAEVCTVPCELCSFKLSTTVCEDPFGYVKFEDYPLQEFDGCLLCDIYYWHCLHPLGERVNCDEEKHEPSQYSGKHIHNVNSPNCEWIGEIDRLKRIDMLLWSASGKTNNPCT
jgi:hypothetical protein